MLTRIECDALRGVANCAFAPRYRAKPHKGFLRDAGVSASRAVRSSPRPGRSWGDTMYCVRGRISYSTTIGAVCYDSTSRKFFKPIEINRTSLPSTTGMVTRGALEYPRRWCYVPCPTDRLESFWWPSMADGELRDDRQRCTLPRADVPKVISHSPTRVRSWDRRSRR